MSTFSKSVLSIVLVLLVLEASARLAATLQEEFAPGAEDWFAYSPTVGWVRRPGFAGVHTCDARGAFDAHGYFDVDSPQIDDLAHKRIVFLGDSNTFGVCVEAQDNFVEVLDRAFPNAIAINLGVPGYSSFQGYRTLLAEGESLRPDVLVVSFNYNDRRYALDRSAIDSVEYFESMSERHQRQALHAQLRRAYLVRALERLMRLVGISREDPGPPATVALDSLVPRVDLESYRENLEAIADWAEAHGTKLLFMVLGDNPVRTQPLNQGISLLGERDYDHAVGPLLVETHDQQFGVLARHYLARAYVALGRTADAERINVLKPFYSYAGGHPIYLDSEYNDVMRDVGSRRGIEVIDARARLNESPGVYIDMCHFDATGHRMVADLLSAPIGDLLAQVESPNGAHVARATSGATP